jgi:mono/diheme cytochrome c family protein
VAIVKDGKGKMPAYGTKLSGPDITAVVAYIRTLQK